MELFLLFIPAVIIPVGLGAAGIWWLLASASEDGDSTEDTDDLDGGF